MGPVARAPPVFEILAFAQEIDLSRSVADRLADGLLAHRQDPRFAFAWQMARRQQPFRALEGCGSGVPLPELAPLPLDPLERFERFQLVDANLTFALQPVCSG